MLTPHESSPDLTLLVQVSQLILPQNFGVKCDFLDPLKQESEVKAVREALVLGVNLKLFKQV